MITIPVLVKIRKEWPFYTAGLILFAYILIRAVLLPPYYDEIITFFTYVRSGDFFPFIAQVDANNHFLNSLLAFLSIKTFGESTFALRLPSVLAFVVYFIYVLRIKDLLQSRSVRIFWFITMLSSFYILSFFSLARGYGLSFAFLTGAIFYLVGYIREYRTSYLHAGMLMLSLAIWSNLSLMIPILVLYILFLLRTVFYMIRNKDTRRKITLHFLLVWLWLIPLIISVLYAFKLKTNGSLYHGLNETFIQTFIFRLPYEFSGTIAVAPILLGLMILVLMIVILMQIIVNFRNKELFYMNTLLWGSLAGIILIHLIFHIQYQGDRTSAHYFILFMGAFFFSIDRIKPRMLAFLGALPACIFLFQLLTTVNFSYSLCWKIETVPRAFYQKMQDWKDKNHQLPTISCNDILGDVIQHYDYMNDGLLNTPQAADFPSNVSDFLVINPWISSDFNGLYDTVITIPSTDVSLLQRKEKFRWKKATDFQAADYSGSNDFITLFETRGSNSLSIPVCIDYELEVRSNDFPLACWVVLVVADSLEQTLSYSKVEMQRVFKDFYSPRKLCRRQFIESIPPGKYKISLYVWNMQHQNIDIRNARGALYLDAIR